MARGGRIAGITIVLNGDATKLNKALSSVDKNLAKTKSALRDIEKGLKLDPKNTELLAQKQKYLAEAISGTKERLETLKSVQKESVSPEQWDALQREIIETEQQLKELETAYGNLGTRAGKALEDVGGKIKAVGDKMKSVGTKLSTYVTLPIVGIGTKAVTSFAEVDKTMTLTNKTMGNTAKEAEILDKAMKSAASNSTFGMADAAEATLNFARAGLDAEQAASALAPAMNLAAGEGGNLDTVSAGLVATINGFGDSFENTTEYADIFAAACNNSALDVDGLSGAMSTAAPIFKTAGYSVKDAALYMGIMADGGIDASEAANALKTGLARLVTPTKDAQTWMDRLGITVTNTDGTMKDTVQIQSELHDKFLGLSESERIAAASAIFGKNQMAKWLTLIQASPRDVRALDNELKNSKGTTEEMATAMMDGFGGSLEKLKSSIDVLMTTLGQLASEHIQPLVDKIQGLVDKFMSLDKGTQQTIVKLAGIAAVAGPLLVIIGTLMSSIGSIVGGIGTVTKALSAGGGLLSALTGGGGLIASLGSLATAAAPFLIGGAIVAGVVAAGVLIVKNWDKIKAGAKKLWDGVKKAWSGLKDAVSGAMEKTKTAVSNGWKAMTTATSNAWQGIKNGVTTAWNGIKGAVSTGVSNAKQAITTGWNTLKTATTNAWTGIRTAVSNAWTNIKSAVSTGVANAKTAITNGWNTVKTATATAWNGIKTTVSTALTNVKNAVSTGMGNVKNAASNAWSAVKTTASNAFSSMKTTASTALQTIKSGFSSALSGLKISNPFTSLLNTAKNAMQRIKSIFSGSISFPKIKMPHFSITGRFSLNPPSVPRLSIRWYKKAYDNAMLFNSPTVLQTPNGLKGFGDGHGGEVVYGRDQLMRDIAQAKGGDITVNVYGTDGMSVNALADAVQQRLVTIQRQRERAFA